RKRSPVLRAPGSTSFSIDTSDPVCGQPQPLVAARCGRWHLRLNSRGNADRHAWAGSCTTLEQPHFSRRCVMTIRRVTAASLLLLLAAGAASADDMVSFATGGYANQLRTPAMM